MEGSKINDFCSDFILGDLEGDRQYNLKFIPSLESNVKPIKISFISRIETNFSKSSLPEIRPSFHFFFLFFQSHIFQKFILALL